MAKYCPSCKETLAVELFHRSSSSADGLQSWCKACKNKGGREKPEPKRRWREGNPDKARSANQNWRDNNPDKIRPLRVRAEQKRRAFIHAQPYEDVTLAELIARYGTLCYYCVRTTATEIEHKVPISRGGSNTYDNCVPSCASCNRKKGTLTHIEYLRKVNN